jgi:DNA-binding response OmpR family regulator
MDKLRVALIEDDLPLADTIRLWLELAGHEVTHFAAGRPFIEQARPGAYELLVIDWMLPDIGGDKVVQWARTHLGWDVGVLFATVRGEEHDIAYALKLGADDYLVKPVRQIEFLARVEAVARRLLLRRRQDEVLICGELRLDVPGRRASVAGAPLALTRKEFDLAVAFLRQPGEIVSRDFLLKTIWGQRAPSDTRTIDTHVNRLKKKLGPGFADAWVITPVHGIGYRLQPV